MTARSPMLAGLAALIATLLSAMGGLPPDRPAADPAAFRCALVMDGVAGGTQVTARVTARDAVAGSYALHLRTGGNAIDQGGDFAASAGETVTLGEAIVPGDAATLDATLSVTAGGRSVDCPRAP